jgi:hypothetical protein
MNITKLERLIEQSRKEALPECELHPHGYLLEVVDNTLRLSCGCTLTVENPLQWQIDHGYTTHR